MKQKLSSILAVLCMSAFTVESAAGPYGPENRALEQAVKPVVYTTPAKKIVANVAGSASGKTVLEGYIALTLTAANEENDTLTGTFIFSITDAVRQQVATRSGKPLNTIPANVFKKDTIARFRAGTSCPVAHLDIERQELELAGLKLTIDRIRLDVLETQEQIPQLVCSWTRQINTKRPRRGIIAALNRLIAPEQ